jgi:hypothetical protein
MCLNKGRKRQRVGGCLRWPQERKGMQFLTSSPSQGRAHSDEPRERPLGETSLQNVVILLFDVFEALDVEGNGQNCPNRCRGKCLLTQLWYVSDGRQPTSMTLMPSHHVVRATAFRELLLSCCGCSSWCYCSGCKVRVCVCLWD